MELEREATPFALLRLDHPSDRVPCDSLRHRDGHRRAGGEDLGHPKVAVTEPGISAQLVVDGDDPDCLAARDQRDVEPRTRTEPARLFLVDLRIVEQRVDPRTLAPFAEPDRSSSAYGSSGGR